MRLDAYLAQYWPEHSRAQWQRLIKQGSVAVNGVSATSNKQELGEDDVVTTTPPVAPDYADTTLPVVYEDQNVIVINKPSGILTHAKGRALDEFSVAEYMRLRIGDEASGNRPGIVHRLDRDTSGIMICTRNEATRQLLQRQFSQRKVKKRYIAIVEGRPKLDEAIIRLPIERNPKQPSTFRVGASGKPAETRYQLLWSDGAHSVLRLEPLTGRTHQLRVHLRHLHTPIVNDRIYNPHGSSGRLALHAYSLEITIPEGDRRVFTAALPADFTALLPQADWEAIWSSC